MGPVPDIKTQKGQWDTRGHRDRIVRIDQEALGTIHALLEGDDVPKTKTRFIQPFSKNTLAVFEQLARAQKLEQSLSNSGQEPEGAGYPETGQVPLWQVSAHWNETAAQKDGTIRRETAFRDAGQMIIQGPLIYVGNPMYKTPKRICNTHKAFDPLDLSVLPNDYRPRTNFGPAVEMDAYRRRMTPCSWDRTKNHADHYRFAVRKMLALQGERTLIGAIVPPGTTHIDSMQSVAFADEVNLLKFSAFSVSVLADFLIKALGKQNIHGDEIANQPWVEQSQTAMHRSLRLAAVSPDYSALWGRHAGELEVLQWSSSDPRLSLEGPVEGPAIWDRTAGLRTEFARRMALVEIDVLVAQALGLTLDQLIEIYRIYFPVLQENEAGTWYDQNGRIVWTCSKGLPGVGWLDDRGKSPGRAAWERILADNPAELTCTAIDDTMPGGPRTVTRHFVGPFTQCDRIEDYRRAWAHFERLKSEEAA